MILSIDLAMTRSALTIIGEDGACRGFTTTQRRDHQEWLDDIPRAAVDLAVKTSTPTEVVIENPPPGKFREPVRYMLLNQGRLLGKLENLPEIRHVVTVQPQIVYRSHGIKSGDKATMIAEATRRGLVVPDLPVGQRYDAKSKEDAADAFMIGLWWHELRQTALGQDINKIRAIAGVTVWK